MLIASAAHALDAVSPRTPRLLIRVPFRIWSVYVPIRYTLNVWPARLAPSAPCSVMVAPAVVLARGVRGRRGQRRRGQRDGRPGRQGDAQRDRDEPVPAVRAGADADDVPHIVSFSYGRGRMPRPPSPSPTGGE